MTTKFKATFMAMGSLLLVLTLISSENNPGKTKSEKIEHLLQEAFTAHEFVGNVIVVDKGTVIYNESFGKANAKSGIPNSDSTKFLIASVSKPFTAIIIMKLVEQGKIDVSDGIEKFFGGAKGYRPKSLDW